MSSSSSTISELELWYASRCDGDWEHSYGVRIDTLDNPGWRLQIDLHSTEKQDVTLDRVKIYRSETDWIFYRVEKKVFHIACGPKNFSEAVAIFLRWFELP